MADERRDTKPHTRLTRLCDAMLSEVEKHPEHEEDDHIIIFIQDSEKGGIALHGYGEDGDTMALADLFVHMRAIFRANGKELSLAGFGKGVGHG